MLYGDLLGWSRDRRYQRRRLVLLDGNIARSKTSPPQKHGAAEDLRTWIPAFVGMTAWSSGLVHKVDNVLVLRP